MTFISHAFLCVRLFICIGCLWLDSEYPFMHASVVWFVQIICLSVSSLLLMCFQFWNSSSPLLWAWIKHRPLESLPKDHTLECYTLIRWRSVCSFYLHFSLEKPLSLFSSLLYFIFCIPICQTSFACHLQYQRLCKTHCWRYFLGGNVNGGLKFLYFYN